MDKEFVRQMLPEKPRPGLLKWTQSNHDSELGEEFLVWSPERFPVYEMDEIMRGRSAHKKVRLARCTCHACESTFYTELNGGLLSFWMDDCGEAWPLDPFGDLMCDNEESWDNGYTLEVGDADQIFCPMCSSAVSIIKSQRLEPGRLKQILVASVEVVDSYVAIIYWLVFREIRPESESYGVAPRDAYVLNEKGRLVHYTHTCGGGYNSERYCAGWRLASSNKDCWEKQYHDWRSINSRKVGGFYWPDIPDLTGTTGEKTGLRIYAKSPFGEHWVQYLKLQRKFPQLENLVNSGWIQLVGKLVSQCYAGFDVDSVLTKALDISKRKPHEMLCMSKAEHKLIRDRKAQWDFDTHLLYRQFIEAGLCGAVKFLDVVDRFGAAGLRAIAEMQRLYGDADLDKLERYLRKQNISPDRVRLLLDTRNAATALADGRALTEEELWPRNLEAAHDRYNRLQVAQIDEHKSAQYQAGFDKIMDEYGELQWTDGELCMVLPKSNSDLIREGAVLRHCVGGYGSNHISRRDVIFFVRHYRRPERSYYTLDINMLDRPYRNQLHGYGNERHGIHKQYSHKIPKKVLDFCDRWEREVLMPWYWDKQKQAQLDQKGSKTA